MWSARLGSMPGTRVVRLRFARLLALLLALGASGGAAHGADTPATERVTLRVWDYPRWPASPESGDRFHWIRKQIAAFEHANPHVQVDLTRLSWDYGADKVRVAVLAGAGPDMIAGVPMTQFIARGLVEPVDAYLTEADRLDYVPAALEAFTWDGATWGWPWYQTGSVLLLNTNRFAAAGVPLPERGHWSHAEFDRALAQLTGAEGDERRYALGFAVRGALGIWPWLFPPGVPVIADGQVPLDGPAARAGVNRLAHYMTEGWAPPGSGGLAPSPVWESFAVRQSTAVAPFGIWAIPALRERANFPFAVAHYPGGAQTFVAVSGWMVLRHNDGARRDAAMTFARFLTGAERQRDLRPYGVFPTRRATGNLYADDAAMGRAAEVLGAGRPAPLHPRWPQIEAAVGTAVQQVLGGERPADEVLSTAAQQLARTIEESAAPPPVHVGPRARGGTYGACAGVLLALGLVLAAEPGRRRRQALCAAPAVAVIGALMLWPLAWSFLLSFATYDVSSGWLGEWVGLRHYRGLVTDPTFRTAVWNTALYTAVVVPVQVATALGLASVIAPLGARTRAWFRGAFYLPGVVSVVVLSLVWRWMFDEDAGALNGVLGFWGIGGVRWLSDPDVALWSIIFMTVARPPGGPMLIYLAAIDAIPARLYDAAALDGARGWRRWRHVTVPLVASTTGFLLITGMIGAFQVFAQVYVLTDGGPGTATTVLVHQIYTTAMRDFAFGRASAMAVVLAVLLVAGAAFIRSRGRDAAVEF